MEDEILANGRNSKFNAGLYQMARLNKLQETLNIANAHPLIKNVHGIYGYQMASSAITSLMMEIFPKLDEEEQKKMLEMKKEIDSMMKLPLFKKIERVPGQITIQINTANWENVRDKLFNYEKEVRMALSGHGFDSPDAEDQNSVVGLM